MMQTPSNNTSLPKSARSQRTTTQSKLDQAKDAALGAADSVTAKAESVADKAISQSKRKADAIAEQGVSQTEDIIRSLGRAIEAGSDSLEQDGMARTASYVRAAASGFDRAAAEVDGINTTRYTDRVEQVVRNNPLLTVGALALAGFALAGAVKKNNKA